MGSYITKLQKNVTHIISDNNKTIIFNALYDVLKRCRDYKTLLSLFSVNKTLNNEIMCIFKEQAYVIYGHKKVRSLCNINLDDSRCINVNIKLQEEYDHLIFMLFVSNDDPNNKCAKCKLNGSYVFCYRLILKTYIISYMCRFCGYIHVMK